MKNSYQVRYKGPSIKGEGFGPLIYLFCRWSIVDALALNASLDPIEIQNYFYSKFVEGEVSEKVLLKK